MRHVRVLVCILGALGACLCAAVPVPLSAQSAATSSAQQSEIDQLNAEIANYQTQLQQVGANKKTLQNAIDTLDLQKEKLQAQITLTQKQISTTQTKLQQLGAGIQTAQQQIQASQLALGDEIRSIDENESESLVMQMLSPDGLSALWNAVDTDAQVDAAIQSNMQSLAQQKSSLAASQNQTEQAQTTLVAQKSTLSSQQTSLTQTTQQKQQLLTETDAQESQYETLLAQAESELNSFSTFSQNAPSGSGILTNQTVCDSWGCYYNQRDAEWGNDALDGTNYTMKSDGCLVTAMAMVMTHYGATGVTPSTINADPSDFAAYEPAYLLFTIQAGGMTATRKTATIDATLATGNPVIVGLNAYGGTHFVVLVSGSKGNYVMKDPYIPNGNDISFSANYSMSQIYSIEKVTVS